MATLVYSRRARSDMADVWVWIADNRSVETADRVIGRIERRIAMLAQHPELGPRRPDIDQDARLLVAERWLVLYAIVDTDVRIVRVLDAAMDLQELAWDE